jgi:hypothetical protein
MTEFIKRAFALLAGFIGHALAGAAFGALVFNVITLFRLLIAGLDFDVKFVLFVSAVGAFFGLGSGFAYLFRQVDAALKERTQQGEQDRVGGTVRGHAGLGAGIGGPRQ